MELEIIKEKLIEDSEKKLNGIKKIDATNINSISDFLSEHLTSFHKARTITRLIRRIKQEIEAGKANDEKLNGIAQKLPGIDFNAKHYKEEILSLRNMLAHVKECRNENGEKFLCSTASGKNFVFSETQSLQARKNLKKYYALLNNIYETISMKNWN